MKKKLRAPRHRTLAFTEEEKARIDKACRLCGGKVARSAIWARFMLLSSVSSILENDPEESQETSSRRVRREQDAAARLPLWGAELRARLQYLNGDR